jgi:hypothetical protein
MQIKKFEDLLDENNNCTTRDLDYWLAYYIGDWQWYYLKVDTRPIMDPDPEPYDWEKHGAYTAKFWKEDPNEVTKGDWLKKDELEDDKEIVDYAYNWKKVPKFASGDLIGNIFNLACDFVGRETGKIDLCADQGKGYCELQNYDRMDEPVRSLERQNPNLAIADALFKSYEKLENNHERS